MKNVFKWLCSTLLLAGMLGCAHHFDITIDSKLPDVASVGTGQRVIIGSFTEEPTPQEPGTRYYSMEDRQLHIELLLTVAMDDSPANVIRKSIRTMLGNSGFELVDAQDSQEQGVLRVRGIVRDFEVPWGATTYDIRAKIKFDLVFERNGRELARRSFEGIEHGSVVFSPMQDKVKLDAEIALSKALRKVSRYLESARFQVTILGVAPDKVRGFHGASNDDDNDGESASSPPLPLPAPTSSTGCAKDTDCKGNRICVNGGCVNP